MPKIWMYAYFTVQMQLSSPEIGCRSTFHVRGQWVEYVNEWTHLWQIMSANCDDKSDIMSRRNALCGQINNEFDVCILLQSLR